MNVSEAMRELGIDKDNFRALALLPLVFVAWADGSIQRAESSLIRKIATDKGWFTGSGKQLLERWLREQPSDEYIRTGLSLLALLASERHGISAAVSADTLPQLLALCKDVAEVAGGRWGLSESISPEEELSLAAVAEAFDIGDAETWRRIVGDIETAKATPAPGPPGHALIGELAAVAKDPLELLMRCLREYGDVVRIRMPGMEWYLVSHPDHVKHVLADNARNYVRDKSFERFRLIVRESIVTTEGDEWRALRRMAQPAFHRQVLGGMADMMTQCADEMVQGWAFGATIDVAAAMHQLMLRIIGQVLFSTDLQSESTRDLSDAVGVALEYAAGTSNPFRLPASIPTPRNLRFRRALKLFERFVADLVARRRDGDEQPTDLMGMLLAATDPDTGRTMTDEQIQNEVLSYLIAGHETSATMLTWVFYALSKHPEARRRVADEIARVIGDDAPTTEHLDDLQYTEQVIFETMRLFPPAFLMPRDVVAEDWIGGFTIPAKSWVLLSPYVTHRRPDVWDNPEGFDPSRFTPEAVAARSPFAFIPFFAGPHKCIGAGLAMMEMKLVLAVVLRRCKLDLVPGFEPGRDPHVTLRTRNGLLMTPRPA